MPDPQNLLVGRGGRKRTVLRDGGLLFRSSGGVPPSCAHLVRTLPAKAPGRVLVGRDPEGVLALAARALWPEAPLVDHHFDAWVSSEAAETLAANGIADVDLAVTADLPPGPFDLVVLPFPSREEALLGRELVEQAHDALAVGGRLLAGTDRSHHWIQKVVREVFGKADLPYVDARRGAVVAARRTDAEARRRDHAHEVKLERNGRELLLLSRPGVFAYGRIDSGTKVLLGAFEAKPGERVLDLGCGIGALGLAAAVDAGPEGVVLVDSNARAVACVEQSIARNGLEGARVVHRADLEDLPGGPFDLVLANPPYFSQGRIADSFARTAAAQLRKGGRCLVVTRAARFHWPILERRFRHVTAEAREEYTVFTARS